MARDPIRQALILAGFLTLVRGGAGAQTEPPPRFPSKAELVTVDLVVVDGKGEPVLGLTRDDFLVKEDGQLREIATFESEMPTTARRVAGPSAPTLSPTEPTQVTQAARRVATNPVAPARGTTFLIVIDDLHLTSLGATKARLALEHFLQEGEEGDRVLMVTTGTGALWSGSLPADREDVLAFVAHLQGRAMDGATPLMTDFEAQRIALYNDEKSLKRVEARYYGQGICSAPYATASPTRTNRTPAATPCESRVRADAQAVESRGKGLRTASLGVVQQAIESLKELRGRKSVLLVTEGFIHDDSDEAYRGAVAAAQRTNAAVYYVDLGGLETLPSASAAAERTIELTPAQLPPPAAVFAKEAKDATDALNTAVKGDMFEAATQRFTPEQKVGVETIADETGGFVVHAANDLLGLGRISKESRAYYLLGYEPVGEGREGAAHRIEVRVKRAGVKVRARRGYTPMRSDSPERSKDAGSRVPALFADTVDASADVPLRLAAYTLEPDVEQKTKVAIVTEVNAASLSTQSKDGRRVAALDVRIVALPRDGGPPLARSQSVEAEVPEAPPPEGVWRSLRLDLALPAGVYQIRALARDPASGKSGVVTQRVEVPGSSALRVSTPILSDVATSAAAGAAPNPALAAHRQFLSAQGKQLFCAFDVYGALKDPETGRADVRSRFVLSNHSGRKFAAPEPSLMALSPSGFFRRILVLPLAQLPPDEYLLALTVEDRVAGKQQEVVESFTVEATPVARTPRGELRAASPAAPDRALSPELAAALDGAGAYVVSYARTFSNIVADEDSQQVLQENAAGDTTRRFMRSGVLFVTLPGPLPWATFRDVFEVDGSKIRDREQRLARIFQDSPAAASERALTILRESARFNLGPLRRTVNIPTLALLFLSPANQQRFTFEAKGRRSLRGMNVLEVAFTERARPTLVSDGAGGDIPSKGRLWIDAGGAVAQTDVEYDLDPSDDQHRTQARIITEYKREPKLDILVPEQMKESYRWPAALTSRSGSLDDARGGGGLLGVDVVARYSGYKRIEVTTDEWFRLDHPDPPRPK